MPLTPLNHNQSAICLLWGTPHRSVHCCASRCVQGGNQAWPSRLGPVLHYTAKAARAWGWHGRKERQHNVLGSKRMRMGCKLGSKGREVIAKSRVWQLEATLQGAGQA